MAVLWCKKCAGQNTTLRDVCVKADGFNAATVSIRQPVVVGTYKTRDGPATTTSVNSSDEITEKYQEIASTIKARISELLALAHGSRFCS